MIAADAVADGEPETVIEKLLGTRKLRFFMRAAPTVAATLLESSAHENTRIASAC